MRARWRMGATLAAVALLSACATYHPRPVTAQSSATSFQQRSLTNAGMKIYLARHGINVSRWPLRQWSVDDLSLAAQHFHPAIAEARDRYQQALAALKTAGAYPNPSLQLTPEFTTNAATGQSPWTINASAAALLITAGKRGDRTAAARADAEAARHDVVSQQWQVRAGIAKAWWQLQAARQQAPLLDAQVNDTRAILTAVTQAVSAGQSLPFEAFVARRAWNRANDARIQGDAALAHAHTALAKAIGIPEQALSQVRLSAKGWRLSNVDLPPSDRLQTYVLTQRADVRAAVLHYAASQSRLKLAIAGQYPNLNIGPGYQWDQGAHRWSIGLSLTLPIFNQNQGPIAEARAQRKIASDKLVALQSSLSAQLTDALTTFRSARRYQALAVHRVRDTRQRLHDTHSALVAGQVDAVSWRRERLQLIQDQLEQIHALQQLLQARSDISALIEHALAPTSTAQPGRTAHPSAAARAPTPIPTSEDAA